MERRSTFSPKLLSSYYLATPLFLLLDLLLGINLRLSHPWESSATNSIYYFCCFCIGYLLFSGSLVGYLIALLECGINIGLLLLSVLWPLFNIDQVMEKSGGATLGLNATDLFHFLMVGGIFIFAFYTNPIVNRGNRER